MKTINHFILIAITLIFLGFTIHVTSAAGLVIPKPSTLAGPSEEAQQQILDREKDLTTQTGGYGATDIIPFLINVFLGMTGSAAFIALIYGGVRYITAYGNETAIGDAKKIIMWAVIGLALAMFSYAIVSVVLRFKIGS